MNILIHLGHPAHYHLFKNVIDKLKINKHKVFIVINDKDILEELLVEKGLKYFKLIHKKQKNNILNLIWRQIIQIFRLSIFSFKKNIDIFVGSTSTIAHVSTLLNKKSISVIEDDAAATPPFPQITYPFTSVIIAPIECNVGKWEYKKKSVDSYHELAYLHPQNFKPSKKIAANYVNTSEKYFILRFSNLNAYHDNGVYGLEDNIAMKLVDKLKKHGKVYITSERKLIPKLEKFRLSIKANDIHHVMSFASILIADSQTMSAESAVIGVPFIRFNDFVGEISYCDNLENKYMLGYGIKPKNVDFLFKKVEDLLYMENRAEIFQQRRRHMLQDKIEYSQFLADFIQKFSI